MSFNIKTMTTLAYLINKNSEVLLIMKKRGFGEGKWNGPGGKVKEGESLKDSMLREVKEETGIKILKFLELGYIEFIWPKELSKNNTRCYIYLSRDFSGLPQESEECLPKWFPIDQIPYDKMWDDDKYWYPQALSGIPIKKRFFFDNYAKVSRFQDIN